MYAIADKTRRGIFLSVSSRVPNDNADDDDDDGDDPAAALKNAGTKIKRGPQARQKSGGAMTTIHCAQEKSLTFY